MKSIKTNGILENILCETDEEKEIIKKWLLDGSPLPNETLQSQDRKDHFQILSHENFKYTY